MTLTLEKMALTKYGTLDAFAKAAGRCKRSAKRLTEPGVTLRLNDMNLLVKVLDIPVALINPLFFGSMYEDKETTIAEIMWMLHQRPDLVEPAKAMAEKLQEEQETGE